MADVVKFENSYYMSEKVKSTNTKYQAWLMHDKTDGNYQVMVFDFCSGKESEEKYCLPFFSPILVKSIYDDEQEARQFFECIINNKFNECQRLGIQF